MRTRPGTALCVEVIPPVRGLSTANILGLFAVYILSTDYKCYIADVSFVQYVYQPSRCIAGIYTAEAPRTLARLRVGWL